MKLAEQIRAQLKASKASHRKVHLATGATRATVKRFLEGSPVTSDTLDAIAEFLGAKITFPPPPPATKKAKGRSPSGT